MTASRHVALLSEHASPLALLGGEDAGGQNVYVDELSRHLAQLGHTVDVFTRRDAEALPLVVERESGVRIINLPAGPAHFCPKDLLWPYMPAFRDAFLDFAAREQRSYDLIHGNFWMSGWVAVELKRHLDVPVVQLFHALGKTKRLYQGNQDTSPPERIEIETQVVRGVDRLIAQCPVERGELIDAYGAVPDKVSVIPAAVNTELFQPVAQAQARHMVGLRLDPDDFVVVYVGRMLPRKDVRNIVRALALLLQGYREIQPPRIKLLVVGGSTEEPDVLATPEIGELQRLACELGIGQHVLLVGKRQQQALRYYYSAGDVVVTTPWYEPFGLTPLEGMACGRPVIGSAVGGITSTLVDGVTGLLVPPRDPEALAARLYQFLQEPTWRARMGRAARRHVEQRFTWPTVAQRTAALYETALQAHEWNRVTLQQGVPGDAVPWPGAWGCSPPNSPFFSARRRRAEGGN